MASEKLLIRQVQLPLFGALFLLSLFSSSGVVGRSDSIDHPDRVIVRGRVVCLSEEGKPLTGDCPDAPTLFGFEGNDGKFYKFLPEDTATAMFVDRRVRARELQIVAVARPKDHLEIIKIQSVREGRLYDLYYFCEVCNITTYAPGLCMCCREEMEFRETPAPLP